MILMQKFTKKQVLEMILKAVAPSVPQELNGTLTVSYTDDDGEIEVFFTEDEENIVVN